MNHRRMGPALFFILIGLLSIRCRSSRTIHLTVDGKSNYRIIVHPAASKTDIKAALMLQDHVRSISGAELPVTVSRVAVGDSVIMIGSAGRVVRFPRSIRWHKLGEDGFTLLSKGNRLYIAGGREKGTLYGVATFLEEALGCRMFSESVRVIPKQTTILLNKIRETQVPVLSYREIHMPDAMDSTYADWHKLDKRTDRLENWGMWVHTFDDLVPPGVYFGDHPEYFSEINGTRVPDYQICLTHPDVFELVIEGLKERMAEKPAAQFWSVSQNDTYGGCQCDSCRMLDEKYGGQSGTLLDFVNRVAGVFPDKTISTLAYQYTRTVPRRIKPAPNVNIVLCSIECNRSKPIATDPSSRAFREDVEGWSRLTDDVLVWDYVVQFRNLVSPFPNLRVLQPNIRFFVKNGVRMLFEQGSGFARSEFHELRTYLLAKLLWNPRADADAVIDEFLAGYYGDAADPIRRYIDRIDQALENSGEPLLIYGNPWMLMEGTLSARRMSEYTRLFDEAEEAVADRPEILERVRDARLPLEFAVLEQARRYGTGERGWFREHNGRWEIRPEMRERLHRFVDRCNDRGFRLIEEHGYSPDAYLKDVRRFLSRNMPDHLALGRTARLEKRASPKYPAGGAAALTDGKKGLEDYNLNWLGFEGEDMIATIDLGEVREVNRIKADFLQDIKSWVFLPVRVVYALSSDAETFEILAEVENRIASTEEGAFFQSFEAVGGGVQARYVRVTAENIKQCPDWHIGKGGKAWIFTDEVEVY